MLLPKAVSPAGSPGGNVASPLLAAFHWRFSLRLAVRAQEMGSASLAPDDVLQRKLIV